MNFKTAFPLLLIFFVAPLFSQSEHDHSHGDSHHHHDYKYELGAGGGAAFDFAEGHLAPAMHLHVTRGLNRVFGLGVGYERIFGEHTHQSGMLLLTAEPVHFLNVATGPGIVFPHEAHDGYMFSWGLEVTFPFELGERLHLGPLLDLGVTSEDSHLAFGLHLGVHL